MSTNEPNSATLPILEEDDHDEIENFKNEYNEKLLNNLKSSTISNKSNDNNEVPKST